MFDSKKSRLNKILPNGKTLLVAFDHGFEHGPAKYEGVSMDPRRVAKIALEGFADGLIVHAGAAKLVKDLMPKDMALIVKLTGKTSLTDTEMQSMVTSVKEAHKIGADGVAVTFYPGSPQEYLMLQNVSKIKDDCMKYRMPLIGFAYPRIKSMKKGDPNAVWYAARVGAEIGFDLVKTYFTGNRESFGKVVNDCFVPLACSGGEFKGESEFLRIAEDVMDAGACGMVVGRNVWMNEHPGVILGKLHNIIRRSGVNGTNRHY
jgi:class I fructose-bisphosphate aldolase